MTQHQPKQNRYFVKVDSFAKMSGLIIETAGTRNQVLKSLPPLIMEEDLPRRGPRIIDDAIAAPARGQHRGESHFPTY
uniref:Uncharacterized protein n=1 Tax=Candidatus Kentrum sp. LFY TaxID=2126342 RepID=A0A450WZ76_9GAMM|nr:MAG: hypothetical protein BECKLFY1418C_GA0070996_11163 [Candidatus Kentron sp. LFY]